MTTGTLPGESSAHEPGRPPGRGPCRGQGADPAGTGTAGPCAPSARASCVRAGPGAAVIYLSLLVLIPIAAVASQAFHGGWGAFWSAVRNPESWAALKLTSSERSDRGGREHRCRDGDRLGPRARSTSPARSSSGRSWTCRSRCRR